MDRNKPISDNTFRVARYWAGQLTGCLVDFQTDKTDFRTFQRLNGEIWAEIERLGIESEVRAIKRARHEMRLNA